MTHRLFAILLCFLLSAPAWAQNEPNYRGNSDSGGEDARPIPLDDAVILPNGRAEFMTVGPPQEAAVAADALRAAGAAATRTRALPNLDLYIVFYDLRGLSLGDARLIVARVAPRTRFDLNALYRLSQGQPRLYAASMLGTSTQACALGGLRIGLIDGAVDPAHPALAGVRVVTHSVLNGAATNPNHGTAVAALIAGRDPTGALTGFAAGADLYAVTAFGRSRGGAAGDVDRIGAALDWLMGNGVRLVNMSFAGPRNDGLDLILTAAALRGAIMIAAAGNDGQDFAAYPAGAPQVIAVTAVDAAGRRYTSANTGPHIEFAAPGVDLYVARRNGGSYASGTSYAAPIITALAARLMARGAGSVDAVRARLRSQSADLGVPGRDSHFGWGLAKGIGC